jgi:signal transduction histidine kinase
VATHQQSSDEAGWVGFSVCDNGPGIPAKEHAAIFERFYRGEAGRASDAPGTGLGLAIAKEIIGRHHGFIEVISPSADGRGTRMMVWLPVE